MDVQADVQKERCSLSGESATVSLGTTSDNASTKAMAGSILNAYMPLDRSLLRGDQSQRQSCFLITLLDDYIWVTVSYRDNSLEVQADVEPKPENMRHSSVSSSLDEASCSSAVGGLKGASGGECCCVQHDGECCSPPHCSKESSAAGDKSCRGKRWRSSSKGGGKFSSKQGGSEAQLLEQRSTNSSEFDSPSLSGSLPSVADSHCSHLSAELSCSDPETSRAAHPPCSSSADTQLPTAAFGDVAIAPLTEVEHDRLEQYPSKGMVPTHRLLSSPPASPKERRALYISEEGGDGVTDTEPEKDEKIPNPIKNMTVTPENSRRKHCIQTDI